MWEVQNCFQTKLLDQSFHWNPWKVENHAVNPGKQKGSCPKDMKMIKAQLSKKFDPQDPLNGPLNLNI